MANDLKSSIKEVVGNAEDSISNLEEITQQLAKSFADASSYTNTGNENALKHRAMSMQLQIQ